MKQSKTELSYSIDTKYEQHWQKESSTKQKTDVLGLIVSNRSTLLGGISALRWRGIGAVLRLAVLLATDSVPDSRPFK
jgi:hypothetical protein